VDALELLTSDHDAVRKLFGEFQEAQAAGDTSRMGDLKVTIFHELEVHTAIEEEVFYPESEKAGPEVEELVKEGVEEHHVVDVLMSELRGMGPDDEEFVPKMTVLIENVEHHADEEEQEMFPKLREAFGDEKLQDMGEALEQAQKRHELEAKSTEELYEKAREKGVEGRSKMSKEELVEALS
jgi:hemerythrin superfamily protein